MSPSRLSKIYHLACSRSQESLVDLYEELHDKKGNPIMNHDLVKSKIQQSIKEIRTELSLISSAIEEIL